jgi:Flp pilus assembly protein TadG
MTDRGRRAPRLERDGGAIVLEAALVVPIFLTLLMTLLDYGSLELRQAQVSSAARDGARTGIVNWTDANIGSGTYSGGSCPAVSATASARYVAVCSAVLARLAGTPVTGITVRCLRGATNVVISSTAAVQCNETGLPVRGVDLLEVSVSYTYSPVSIPGRTFLPTPFQSSKTSRMVML